jgi:glycosyltransferase involved in cell wall biosynthesis
MRIAVNGVSAGGVRNGITTYIEGLLGCLQHLHHEVIAYCSTEQFVPENGLSIRRCPSNLTFEHGALARTAWTQAVLPLRLRKDRAELLISPYVEGAFWPGIPQILVVHDVIPLYYPEESSRLHFYYAKVLPKLLSQVNTILAVSEYTRQDLIKHYGLDPSRVRVVYNGLRESLFQDTCCREIAQLKGSGYFLFVGSFSPRKNLDTVVRGFAKIMEHVPERLAIVAYPDERKAALLHLATQCGVSERLVFLSGLADAEMNFAYRNATALVLLSEYEGFGYPPLEAMAVGTPAIVSDATSLSETTGDAGVKVPSHDVEAAASAMCRIARDREYRTTIAAASRRRARCFTWANTAVQLQEAIDALLETNTRAS